MPFTSAGSCLIMKVPFICDKEVIYHVYL
uniref:Uncharacterized protein n=1 Tax=Anguilla anguilla TaxID=7936 RepID=A0A0E9PMZ8_ANGAN